MVEEIFEALGPEELQQVLMLTRRHRHLFSSCATRILATARDEKISQQVAHYAIMGECLLLAAYMHQPNNEKLFLENAAAAYKTAEVNRKIVFGVE